LIDITQIINQHGGGSLLAELNDNLQRLVKDCCDTNKKGQIGLTLAIEPIPMRDGGHQIKVTPGITSKNPKYDSGVELFFVVTDEENLPVALETENPRQMQIFNQLAKEAKEAKENK
jgi:hypothetical protein